MQEIVIVWKAMIIININLVQTFPTSKGICSESF